MRGKEGKQVSIMSTESKLKPCPFCQSVRAQQTEDFVACNNCGLWGPEEDPSGHKWNSIPRKPEVRELIELVRLNLKGGGHEDELDLCAGKLRKEMAQSTMDGKGQHDTNLHQQESD